MAVTGSWAARVGTGSCRVNSRSWSRSRRDSSRTRGLSVTFHTSEAATPVTLRRVLRADLHQGVVCTVGPVVCRPGGWCQIVVTE